MENPMFSFDELGFDGIPDKSLEAANGLEHSHFHEDWTKLGNTGYGGFHNPEEKQQQQQQVYLDNAVLGNQGLPINSSTVHPIPNGISELSTEDMIRMAGARFIQSYSGIGYLNSMFSNPYDISFCSLSDEDSKSVQLLEFLIASAEKVSNQQFESARRLLSLCDSFSSEVGNPVQRVVHYFSEALREKIDRETGQNSDKGIGKSQLYDIDQAVMSLNSAVLVCYQTIPFTQAAHFAGVQAILENVGKAKKVHVIDLQMGNGVQWTALMQALASRRESPIELFKISAVATTSGKLIEDSGKRLMTFAESINVPFSFKVVIVSDMAEIREDLFEVQSDEAVAVYSEFLLQSLIARPSHLDSVMVVLRNINPRVMVILEVEANVNSPSFGNRFIEALFFFSVYFDCFETCMERDNPNRRILESTFFCEGIRNSVAAEGEERNIRPVKINTWRAFFARFGMTEAELSMLAYYQVNLMLTTFAFGKFCTVGLNEKSLIIGWKGTPIQSLSVWKFNVEKKNHRRNP